MLDENIAQTKKCWTKICTDEKMLDESMHRRKNARTKNARTKKCTDDKIIDEKCTNENMYRRKIARRKKSDENLQTKNCPTKKMSDEKLSGCGLSMYGHGVTSSMAWPRYLRHMRFKSLGVYQGYINQVERSRQKSCDKRYLVAATLTCSKRFTASRVYGYRKSTNQRSVIVDADWPDSRDEREGGGLQLFLMVLNGLWPLQGFD